MKSLVCVLLSMEYNRNWVFGRCPFYEVIEDLLLSHFCMDINDNSLGGLYSLI